MASKPTTISASETVTVTMSTIVQTKHVHFVTLEKDNYVSWKDQVLVVHYSNKLLDYVEGNVWLFESPLFCVKGSTHPRAIALDYGTGDLAANGQPLYFSWGLDFSGKTLLLVFDDLVDVIEASISHCCRGSQFLIMLTMCMLALQDRSLVIGKMLQEKEVILATIEGLGARWEPFVTSITTWFDHDMTFIDQQALMVEHEIPMEAGKTTTNHAPISVNMVANASALINAMAKSRNSRFDVHLVPCQIYGCKVLDCDPRPWGGG